MGIAFCVLALLCGIFGVCKGFVNRLFGFWLVFLYIAGSIVATPIVCAQPFVSDLIQDELIRMIVVFVVLLFSACMISALVRWVFKQIFLRVKLLGFFNRLLGLAFDVALIWGIFGIFVACAELPVEFFAQLASPLQQFNADLPQTIANGVYEFLQSAKNDEILTMIYGYGNPIGEFIKNLVIGMLQPVA